MPKHGDRGAVPILQVHKAEVTCPRPQTRWRNGAGPSSLLLAHPDVLPFPHAECAPFSSAEFQKEAEPEGKKKGKFKTMKVLKLLGNKRDTKSKSPGDKS